METITEFKAANGKTIFHIKEKISMETHLKALQDHIIKRFIDRYAFSKHNIDPEFKNHLDDEYMQSFRFVEGKQYIKIVANGSAYGFIVKGDHPKFKDGDILKANSWTAPAKNKARGNIYNPESYKHFDWTSAS
ncbi:MAG: hypothetical protein PHG08_01020 [Bacilli bacterium]|nr:hypothetical protein [Bacilli bacterium]